MRGSHSLPRGEIRASRRAILTVIDQGFSSVSNFAVGVAVARVTGARGLGAFSLAYAGWLVVASLHRSLVTDPMSIEGDARGPHIRQGIEVGLAAELILGVLGAVVFGLLGVIILLAGQPTFGLAMLTLAPWIPALVIQDYWRWVGFMTSRPQLALINDTVFNLAQAAAFATMILTHSHAVPVVIASWAIGGLAGAVYGLRQHNLFPSLRRGPRSLARSSGRWLASGLALLRNRWAVSRWIAGTSITSWGASQAYVIVGGFILGPAGLGGLRAAQTLVTGPSFVLIQAGGSIGLPEATRAYAENGWPGLNRVARIVTACGMVSVGACMVAVALFGRYLLTVVYGPQFAHLQPAALLYGVAYTITAFSLGPILVLKATRNTHFLFHVQLATLVASLGSVAILSALYGIDGAAGAATISGVVGVVGIRWCQRLARRSAATDSTPPLEVATAGVAPAGGAGA